MGLRINQNIAAQNAYRSLSVSDSQMGKSLEKLSSGFRINRAADDAAGLAISEGLRSQVGGLKVATRNAQDGVSVVQTAEGALGEVHSILQRMRDLGVQAGNDSNNAAARNNITTEVDSLTQELTRIGDATNFNGKKLLDGSASSLKFQVGADGNANSQIAIDLSSANVKGIATTLTTAASATTSTTFAVASAAALAGNQVFSSGTAPAEVTSVTVAIGGAGTVTSVQDYADKLNANSTFAANFSASVTKDVNGAATGIAVRSTNGSVVNVASPGTGAAAGASGVAGTGLRFDTADNAQASVNAIDTQIAAVSTARAKLGAYQNRFEHTINNTNVAIENLSASESRIRDTDMAQEMMSYTRSQILTQAGTAMLAQANQSQQGVLSLLR
jgi:flagellin